MNIEKKNLRMEILKKRAELTSGRIEESSGLIWSRLLSTREYAESSLIMCYMDFRSEVRTGSFIRQCLLDGKRVALPRIIKNEADNFMEACEISSLEDDFRLSPYGILEPSPAVPALSPSDIDLVIVPGVAFDVMRYRLGYGGGYYDYFLKATREACIKTAVAFQLQIVDKIPVEPHDYRMTSIITEAGIIK